MTTSLTFWLSALVGVVVGTALALNPLLGVHGVESALALGILLPPWVAATAANYQRREGAVRGIDLMSRAIGSGLVIWSIPVVILALNSLRVRQCAPWEGLAFMVLGPAIGCALAAVTGVWVAALLPSSRWSPWVAAAVPIGGLLWGLWAFYTTPTVYVFGAFAGYFPGAIYDDFVPIPERYLTYRSVTLVTTVALVLLFDALWDRVSELLHFGRGWRYRPGTLVVGLAMLGLVAGSYSVGNHLGFWITADYLSERLGKSESGKHCVVYMPRETPPPNAKRLVEDCDFQVARTRSMLGLESTEPVTAYFFRTRDEKKALIGVGRTLIAKPWRSEVYLQVGGWPHPVLGHEVAHAVLKDAAMGPFSVAGRFGGLLPNPGVIEGAAVALAWDLRDDMDPDQWSRIMLDRDELPPAGSLTGLRFSALPPRRAYMAAGSLMRFLIVTRGTDSFLRDYRDGAIDDLDTLETEWHAYLSKVQVTDHERGIAEVALAEPSIFAAVCPHRLAKLRADLAGDAAARDDTRTLETCRAILDVDMNDPQAHAALIGALARTGNEAQARTELDALRAAMNAPKPIVANALEQFADAIWTLGDLAQAAALYDELLSIPRTDGPARQSEVKKLALAGSPEEQALVYQMLIEPPSPPVAVHIAQALADARTDGLGRYLEGRQLLFQGRYGLALPLLQEAEALGVPTERLERELGHMLGVALFAEDAYAESQEVWQRRKSISPAAAADAQRWIERIEYAQTGQVSPTMLGPSSVLQAGP
ncbi:MAG: tetratricopeptide repeat protein [Myxococcales bacterium]|nr:tetratricopeptide repeat protein [Myxococcales bacterium]